jgi:hypothetical protein
MSFFKVSWLEPNEMIEESFDQRGRTVRRVAKVAYGKRIHVEEM